ncbi:DNA polymerase delta subunit 4-like [Branchiostoma floridae]|uniref:DNA polymerase delta subunit 4-like n=1 Tax=Branchiostoma floridae TaxID=7739 RepID=A0A9J7LX84_BRAFL|nr:DNA polymerase delta subunit 4-like [Branchiostoma floridae]
MSQMRITDTFQKVKRPGRTQKQGKPAQIAAKSSQAPAQSTSDAAVLQRQTDIQLLKQFDLNPDYGPSIGITRLERWERAEKFGLTPPEDVRDLIVQHTEDEEYTHCLWNDYKQML